MTIDPRDEDALRGGLAALTRSVQAAPGLHAAVLSQHRRQRQRRLAVGAAATAVLAGGAVALPVVVHRSTAGQVAGQLPGRSATLVLTARTDDGRPVDAATLERTSRLVRQRLADIGLPNAAVRPTGSQILVSVPADRVADAELVSIRGELLFRPVRKVFPDVPAGTHNADPYPGATPTERELLTDLDCGKPPPPDAPPGTIIATCSIDGSRLFILERPVFGASQLATATATPPAPEQGAVQWRVMVGLEPAARAAWADWTRHHVGSGIAFTLDDRVISFLTVAVEITGPTGVTPDSPSDGEFTESGANNLAAVLNHGPLPVTLHLTPAGQTTPTPR